MATLQALRRQVEGAEDLHSIVRAMKSISAVRIRQFRVAVESLEDYARTLELGFHASLRGRRRIPLPHPAPDAPAVAVVFGADQGLAGQFNTRVLELAEEAAADSASRELHVFAVGARLAERLAARRRRVAERFPAAGSIDEVGGVVRDLLVTCRRWREERGVERFTLFYNDYRGGASYEPVRVELLPLEAGWLQRLREEPWPGPSLPAYRIEWPALFELLVREHLFVTLYRACAESGAAENASRLSAMEAAESRIEERLGRLEDRLNRQRQQAITEELLEVVSGFRALEEEDEAEEQEEEGEAGR